MRILKNIVARFLLWKMRHMVGEVLFSNGVKWLVPGGDDQCEVLCKELNRPRPMIGRICMHPVMIAHKKTHVEKMKQQAKTGQLR